MGRFSMEHTGVLTGESCCLFIALLVQGHLPYTSTPAQLRFPRLLIPPTHPPPLCTPLVEFFKKGNKKKKLT